MGTDAKVGLAQKISSLVMEPLEGSTPHLASPIRLGIARNPIMHLIEAPQRRSRLTDTFSFGIW